MQIGDLFMRIEADAGGISPTGPCMQLSKYSFRLMLVFHFLYIHPDQMDISRVQILWCAPKRRSPLHCSQRLEGLLLNGIYRVQSVSLG